MSEIPQMFIGFSSMYFSVRLLKNIQYWTVDIGSGNSLMPVRQYATTRTSNG